MQFTFLHAADLHIDSPLDSLGARDAAIAAQFREAGRAAVMALVDEAISSRAAFLIIAGDIFDAEWKDLSTGLFFMRELARLARADIPVFAIKGNHDAESVVSRNLPDMPGIMFFGHRKAASLKLDALQVALHGRSYPDRQPPAGFVDSYPASVPGWLNIGILHTALEGGRGHEPYAPCTVEQLRGFDYDYWALGHVHAQEIVSRDPWIVYPGNIQGRSVREAGAKGVMRVSVSNGRIRAAEPVVLDRARWANARVDVSGCAAMADVAQAIEGEMSAVLAGAQDRAVALRLTLHGASALHAMLAAGAGNLLDDARLRAAGLPGELWIEQVRLETLPLPAARPAGGADSLDLGTLLDAALQDADFARALVDATALAGSKFPKSLGFDPPGPATLSMQARDLLLGRLADAGERP